MDIVNDIVKNNNQQKTSVRYQIAFYEDNNLLGGFDIERDDIEIATPYISDDIEVNGKLYEVSSVSKKYVTEFNTVVFCVNVKR